MSWRRLCLFCLLFSCGFIFVLLYIRYGKQATRFHGPRLQPSTYSGFLLNTSYSTPKHTSTFSNHSLSSHFTVCHTTNTFAQQQVENVLIIGATSFVGSKLAVSLHRHDYSVEVVDDENAIPLEPMAWYRWQMLQKMGLTPKFVDMKSVLSDRPKIDTVVFVPSPIFDGVSSTDTMELKSTIKILENFVNLLETIHSNKLKVQVVLLSISNSASSSLQMSWLKTLELSLSSYNGLYGIRAKLVRMDGVYGEWQGKGKDVYPNLSNACQHIAKVEEIIMSFLWSKESCIDIDISKQCPEDEGGMAVTQSWADEYTLFLNTRKDVVFSTYFTKPRNPMYSYRIRSKSGLFMKQWFVNLKRLGLSVVIFHDNFDDKTINRIKEVHPETELVKVDQMNGRTTNDYRFYAFHDYLRKHPEVRFAVLTDMRDVKFFANPFERMEVIGDYIYVGIDVSFYLSAFEHSWLRGVLRHCHRSEAVIDEVKLHPFFNAGVLGGARHSLLAFLHQMTKNFDKSPHYMNCNMGTINLVAHKYFYDYTYSGYPIQSAFKLGMEGHMPQGQAIKHKDTEKYRY